MVKSAVGFIFNRALLLGIAYLALSAYTRNSCSTGMSLIETIGHLSGLDAINRALN